MRRNKGKLRQHLRKSNRSIDGLLSTSLGLQYAPFTSFFFNKLVLENFFGQLSLIHFYIS
jgi:hypothetical protein